MAIRRRPADRGRDRGRQTLAALATELRTARLDRGLSSTVVAAAAGISRSQYSRIERGLVRSVSIERIATLLAVVGLDLSARAYPAGQPLRDAGHAALLGRLRARLHRSLRFATEVPFPTAGDPRAWDAVISGPGWRYGVEAETRPTDLQALERRLSLKVRDGSVDGIVLVLLDSRHDRDLVRAHAAHLAAGFPVPGRRALELLGAGVEPGGSAVILL